MKKMKKFVCSFVFATFLATSLFSMNVFADETNGNTTTETVTSEDGNKTTTTTTTVTTDENGATHTEVNKNTVEVVMDPSLMPLTINVPSTIPKPIDDVYTIEVTVNHTYDLDGLRFVKGFADISAWDSGTACTTTVTIPVPESDSFYTLMAKDVKGNSATASIYVHCEKETTPTPTPTPITCPEGTTMDENGNCVTPTPTPPTCPEGTTMDENGNCVTPTPTPPTCPEGTTMDENGNCVTPPPTCPEGTTLNEKGECVPDIEVTVAPITITPVPETAGCPDGYTLNADGMCYSETAGCPDGYTLNADNVCVIIPEIITKVECPEGQYLDENGKCVQKVQSLPQTGGFDTLMMFFIFGIGATVCGTGVIAYANKKEKENKK